MKTWLFIFSLLVLLCISIEAFKTKHGKNRIKHNDSRNETSKETLLAKTKSLSCRIGQFALDLQVKSKNSNKHRRSKQIKKNPNEKISKLLRELTKCMEINLKNVTYKQDKKNAKKAMIWPTKLLPHLEKMLLNKIGGDGIDPGDNNGDNGYENYDNPTSNSFAVPPASPYVGKNDFLDNWDIENPRHHHKTKFHGMDVVPLLKMLKENIGDSSPYDSNAFTGMPVIQRGSKYLTKLLLNQALGKPDKGSVMREMMQEFFLANENDRSGEEAREAFNELLGHNNLIGIDNQIENENSAANFGPSQGLVGMSESPGRREMERKVQGFGSQAAVLQAQELPNVQIAPLNQPAMGQRMIASKTTMEGMIPQSSSPTTRMLNNMNVNAPNILNMPSMTNVQNFPTPVNSEVENQLVERMAAERPDERSRSVPLAQSDNLIFEEEGESAARGIRPPQFQGSQREYDAQRVMRLGANYKSFPIPEPQRPIMSSISERPRIEVGMNGERFGDKAAVFLPAYPQQELAERRDDLPSSHKHSSSKITGRSKNLLKLQSMKNRTNN